MEKELLKQCRMKNFGISCQCNPAAIGKAEAAGMTLVALAISRKCVRYEERA